MLHFDLERYKAFNGFYTRGDVRSVLHDIFGGKCSASGDQFDLADCDIDHIVPRSEAEFFAELFPGLDVDNVINLTLLDASLNRKLSNSFPKTDLAVYYAISYNMRVLEPHIKRLLEGKTFSAVQSVGSSKDALGRLDPRQALSAVESGLNSDLISDLKLWIKIRDSLNKGRQLHLMDSATVWRFFEGFSSEEFMRFIPEHRRMGKAFRYENGEVLGCQSAGLRLHCGTNEVGFVVEREHFRKVFESFRRDVKRDFARDNSPRSELAACRL